MHEASLMRDLMRKIMDIAKQQNAARVQVVNVRLGALSHMSAAHFQEHFDQAAAGTIAEGAKINAIEETDHQAPGAADVILESIEVS
jgi:hydrogenase nickel incorporation protein HypA/HybF